MEKQIVLSSISLEDLEAMMIKCIEKVKVSFNKSISSDDRDSLLTVKEAAKFLKVSEVSIHKWKREGKLEYHKLGRNVRFTKSDLIDFAQSRNC